MGGRRRPPSLLRAAAWAAAVLAAEPLGASAAASKAPAKAVAEVPSQAATKARVESGDGVPFFQERFGCRDDGAAWSAYRELVQYSRLRIFEAGEGPELSRALAYSLAEQTANVSEILQCNVGIIAGYHLLARHSVAIADDWRAYSLLQLALIWVFTLRNANRVPSEASREWFTRSDHLIHEIRTLRRRLSKHRARWVAQLPQVSPNFRQPGLRIGIVSVCAYPADHPLELKTLTPENRVLYAQRHGYGLHVHRLHPLPDQGVHVQHAKLALMAEYLKSGAYDWVAWFDCDSIMMNLDKTLDSIIQRYAEHPTKKRRQRHSSKSAAGPPAERLSSERRVRRTASSGDAASTWKVSLVEDELSAVPAEVETVVGFVMHQGSCNSETGCREQRRVKVRPGVRYKARVETALIDMEDNSERLASISIGGRSLGPCNPKATSDYDCGFFECFTDAEILAEATAMGELLLEAHSVKTNDDCMCSTASGSCYSVLLGAYGSMLGENGTMDATFGMFVKFTLIAEEAGSAALSATKPSAPTAAAAASRHPEDDPTTIMSGGAFAVAAASGSKRRGAHGTGKAVSNSPDEDREIVAYLKREGSCNTAEGCIESKTVQVNPGTRYLARVTTSLIDMEDDSERLASLTIGGKELGDCNPSPESDFDCGYFDCFQDVVVPVEASSSGRVTIEVHTVRTSNDCHCSEAWDGCMNRAEAALYEATGQGHAPASFGMFVKVTLTPDGPAEVHQEEEREAAEDGASQSAGAEPGPDEDIIVYVSHAGSCNTVGGCRGSVVARVNPARRYRVTVATILVDMEDDSEKLSSVVVGGKVLGECNPSPASDYDCGLFECFRDEAVPIDASNSGQVLLEVHSVRTNDDCMCNQKLGACYATPLAAMYEELGENVSDSSYGMYVKFTLSPENVPEDGLDELQPGASWASASPVLPPDEDLLPLEGAPSAEGAPAPLDEPLEDEVIEAYVSHIGSCNSDEGCQDSTHVRVNRRVRYEVTVTTALVDMAEHSERLASVSVNGFELGECNPSPEDDFDCGYSDCFEGELLPAEATSSGTVELKVHSVRTSADCHCNRLMGFCYSAMDAAFGEAAGGDPLTDPRYGMFVRFTLRPVGTEEVSEPPIEGLPHWVSLRRRGAECTGADVLLGTDVPLLECLERCREVPDCVHVASGVGKKLGMCFWQLGGCSQFEEDYYDVYQISDADTGTDAYAALSAASTTGSRPTACADGAGAAGAADVGNNGPAEDAEEEEDDEDIDLLITEEGWGLSSANWLIRRSDWSISFLEDAFRLCHEGMPLFGDQDAMIHLLLNDRALLSKRARTDRGPVVDRHAVIIPQHELNAYDALNAFYMEADAYTEGDLLITFPGCKEAGACNPLFRLAAAHAKGGAGVDGREEQVSWPHVRVFGPPEAAAQLFETARLHQQQQH